jgi:hypothetical protein
VLIPDRFEVIESEITNGILQYQMALSARPTKLVRVHVALKIREIKCYGYDAKLELPQKVYEFDSENYKVLQNVTISVRRLDASRYEGAFSASLEHTITTKDELFQSAFLRPVPVALQDDSLCVENATAYDGKDGIRKCGCMKGFYIDKTDSLFCDTVTSCVGCPEGMICAFQQNHTLAELEKGFYRNRGSSLNVVTCPDPSTQCVGNATSGDELCADGHEGAFCMVCKLGEKDRYVWSGDECSLCDGSLEATAYAILAVIVLLCIFAALFISRGKTNGESKWTAHFEEFGERVQTKYKILITFTQVRQVASCFS